jgi:hypothetical protein
VTTKRRGMTEEAAGAAIDQACRMLRMPTIRNGVVCIWDIAAGSWTATVTGFDSIDDLKALALGALRRLQKNPTSSADSSATPAWPTFNRQPDLHGQVQEPTIGLVPRARIPGDHEELGEHARLQDLPVACPLAPGSGVSQSETNQVTAPVAGSYERRSMAQMSAP